MKRVNEIVEKVNENLGVKKARIFSGIDECDRLLERNQDGEGRGFAGNGVIEISEIDGQGLGGFFGNEGIGDSEFTSDDSLNIANKWDFDINFDLLLGNQKGGNGLGFDLNDSVAIFEGGSEKVFREFTLGPVINEKRTETIVILSDDSDDEVEIIGFNHGYKTNIEQRHVGMLYGMTENFDLGLEINRKDYFIGESSSVIGYERRNMMEEKGKGNMDDQSLFNLDNLISSDSWPFFNVDDMISNYLWRESEFAMGIRDFRGDDELISLQPAALPAISEVVELDLRQAGTGRRQVMPFYAVPKETARRLARVNYPWENSENASVSMETRTPTLEVIEQLGKSFGPFSEAFKKVKERTSKRAAKDLIEWKPSQRNRCCSFTAPVVPSLLNLASKALAENAEGIVSLEWVPDVLRKNLADMLCDKNQMNVHILNLLVEGCPTEVRIKNCSWLTETQFQQTIGNCQTKNLRVLQLDLCGQIMLDLAFRDTFGRSTYGFSNLAIISLRGACRLSDSGLKELLASAPALQSINLGQCTLLTSDSINFIAQFLGSNLKELYIDGCQKINTMHILPAFRQFKYLDVLSVADMESVTDQFISEVLIICGQRIMELDLANCLELTDCSLKAIGNSCINLRSLNISNLHKLTDLGMEYLANGCRSIQKLVLCRNRFSDEVIAAFLESSGRTLTELSLNNVSKVGCNSAFSLAKCAGKLVSLDISWCRGVSNEALGLIVDSCSSLKLLKVFGCRQITRVFVTGHSNPVLSVIGLNLSPILESVNLAEPQKVLLRYSALSIPEIDVPCQR